MLVRVCTRMHVSTFSEPSTHKQTKKNGLMVLFSPPTSYESISKGAALLFQEQIEADLPSVSVTANANVH